MEIFLLTVLGIIIIVLISNFRKEVKNNMRILNKNIINVRKELDALKTGGIPTEEKTVAPTVKQASEQSLKVAGQRLKTSLSPTEKEKPKPVVPVKKVEEKPVIKPVKKAEPQPATKPLTASVKPVIEKATIQQTSKPAPAAKKPAKPVRDYEKLIGENWLNKVGIAILVIGIGFFVKYAIDKNWIGEVGRVGIGLLTGGILVGIAHFMRKKYRAFSSVLIGGGVSVMYYTISIAYHDYGLLGQKGAFMTMIGITLLGTIMAILYDRKELAIIALIGGFTSPFMVQGETGNYVAFFTYIAILNSGMLILSFFKKWPIIFKLALGFTVLFFGTWMMMENMHDVVKSKWSIAFSTIYFIQFFGASLVYNFIRKAKFNAWEFIQLASITALYYGATLCNLTIHEHTATYSLLPGGFTLIMSLFYAGIATATHLREGTDKALTYLLIGKAVSFITLTGALLFNGDYMTLFWATESIVILALGIRARMKVLINASILMTLITTIGLIKDWIFNYMISSRSLSAFSNETFFTGLYFIGILIGTFFLIQRMKDDEKFLFKKSEYQTTIGALIFGLGYITLLLEIIYQLDTLEFNAGEALVLWMYHIALIVVGIIVAKIRKSSLMTQAFYFTSCIATVAYIGFGLQNNYNILKAAVLYTTYDGYYYLHFLLVAGMIGLLLFIKNKAKTIFEDQKQANAVLGIISVIGLIFATAEMHQIITFIFSGRYGMHTVESHVITEGYTILWGLYSFFIMIRGMQVKNRVLRILALVLFSITLLKLFIVDIRNISEAGKILAFISLGILLLVVSFMYQRLKAIIVGEDNEEQQKIEE